MGDPGSGGPGSGDPRSGGPRSGGPRSDGPRSDGPRSDSPRFDLPEADAFTRTYWDAAAEGTLLVRQCRTCGRAHHYPREFCPHCWSEDVTWQPASGRATLYTWSVVHRNDLLPFGARTPYVAAVVDLAEGPRMMTEVVECADAGPLRAGMDLEVAFRGGVPVFRPAR